MASPIFAREILFTNERMGGVENPKAFRRYLILVFSEPGFEGNAQIIDITNPLRIESEPFYSTGTKPDEVFKLALDTLRALHREQPYNIRVWEA